MLAPPGPDASGGAGEHVALLAETHGSGARLVLPGIRVGGFGDVAQAAQPDPVVGGQEGIGALQAREVFACHVHISQCGFRGLNFASLKLSKT